MEIVKETIRLLHEKLAIPAEYHIAFVSSATECWEIVAQSLTINASVHPTTGAFGEKWREYAHRIKPYDPVLDADTLCIVQNETSNGTQVTMPQLADWRRDFDGLIAVDAVSSLGGIVLDWSLADVWFCSSQKCLGLPAGLGLLIYGPRALERAEQLDERQHYNSLLFIHENAVKFQTQYTPNGLGIYCLMRVMQQVPPIAEVDAITKRRAADWYTFFEMDQVNAPWTLLINDPALRSDTVIAVQGTAATISTIKADALKAGITLGSGYGHWKDTTFRIANFPAIDDAEIGKLKTFLRHCLREN